MSESDPTHPDRKAPGGAVEQQLRDLYTATRSFYEKDCGRHVEPTALTEYLFVVQERVDVRDDSKAELHAKEIKRELSRDALSALKGKGGVSQCSVSRQLLTREGGSERYWDEEAEEYDYRTLGATIYEPSVLVAKTYTVCSNALTGGPVEWARAAQDLVEGDDRSKLSALKTDGSNISTTASASGSAPEEPSSSPRSGFGSSSPRSSSSPYGRDIDENGETPSQDADAADTPSASPEAGEKGGPERSLEGSPSDGSGRERSLERYAPDRERWKARDTLARRRYLDKRVRHVSERLLFLELYSWVRGADYSSSEQDEKHMDWVGVSAEFMEQHMGAPYHETKLTWRGSELIEAYRGGYYVPEEESRKFRIYKDVLEEFMELGDDSRRYWLHTEKLERTSQPSPMSSDLSDENNNKHPHLIQQGMKALSDVRQPIKIQPIRDAIKAKAQQHTQKARAQKLNLQIALETIERQVVDEDGEVSYLKNAYTPDDSGGRVSFKRGGPQGMMGEVKSKAFDIPGIRNFDISSCHTSALKQWADILEDLGVEIDTSPLDGYPGKYIAADDHDLPVSLVKTTEHSVKNSAYLPATLAQGEVIEQQMNEDRGDEDEELTLDILDEAREADVDTERAVEALYEIFADYRKVAVEIAKALLTAYWDEHKHPGGPRGWCVENHAGKSFYRCEVIEDEDNEDSWCHDARTAVMAWALRGLESAFCHAFAYFTTHIETITTAANEHDGLILLNKAESGNAFQNDLQHAIDYARERSGFTRAEFVEKAFADEEDVQQLYGEDKAEDGGTETAEGEAQDNTSASESPSQGVTEPTSGDKIPMKLESPETQEQQEEMTEEEIEKRYVNRKRRAANGDVPDTWQEAKAQGFTRGQWRAGWKIAHGMREPETNRCTHKATAKS